MDEDTETPDTWASLGGKASKITAKLARLLAENRASNVVYLSHRRKRKPDDPVRY